MMPVALLSLLAAVSYFIGNINPAILIGRAYGVDVRAEGSGNAGTTNAMRTIGRKAGVMVFLIDAVKGYLPAALFPGLFLRALALDAGVDAGSVREVFGMGREDATALLALMVGLCVILGHMWPVVFRFKGGRGVATAFGVLLAVEPLIALILIGIVLALAAATRIMSLSVIVACAAAVPLNIVMGGHPAIVGAIVALVVLKHRENIVRLAHGEEKKITFGSKEKDNG
jgi:glycerol-3-phosphate acyltransferase PlsY